jgi:riboflavin-specific deaminase-like protein
MARFAFLAGMTKWTWMRAPLPESNHRKLCFAFFVWALVVAPMPWVSPDTGYVLSFFATLLVLMSFAVDIGWLRAHGQGHGSTREDLPPAQPGNRAWGRMLQAAHEDAALVPLADATDQEILARFRPILGMHPDRPFVVGHLAQSIDGHIALDCGASQWISGPDDLVHTHRLRALVDAVLVGTETALRDNPRLTVRETEGPNPLRVVLDPNGRLNADCHLCRDTSAPTLILVKTGRVPPSGLLGSARVREVSDDNGYVHPSAILGVLHDEGIRRVLVEGGGITVSRFVEAGLMDRLHLTVAPLWLGEGRPALHLPGVGNLEDALRPPCRVDTLGGDVLFDFDLTGMSDSTTDDASQ